MLWKLPSSESGNSLEIFEPQTKFSTWRFRVNFQDRFEQLGFWLYPMSNKTRNLENCLCLTLSWVISPSSWWHLFDHFNDHWDFRDSQPQGYRFWHYLTGCLGYQAVLPVSAPPGVIINRHSSFCVTWEFESFNFWSSSTHLSGPQGSRALCTHSNHIIICKNKPFLTSSSIICLMGFSQTNQNVWASKESSLRVRHSMIVIRYPFTFIPPLFVYFPCESKGTSIDD